MFISRERRGRDRFLWFKLACLVLGGVLGLVGMSRDRPLLVDLAIVVILAGFALRFVPQKTGAEEVAPRADAPVGEPRPLARP
jgi:hypothetical protein